MQSLLHRVDGFQDLLKYDEHGLPYRFETIFKDGGWRDRRASKKKLKLLRRIDEALRPVLEEGEEVRFLSHGTTHTFLEAYFMGLLLYYFNKRAIVLTDRRILLIQIHRGNRPGVLRSQVRYTAITRVKRSLFGNTVLKLQDRKKLTFLRVPKGDAKFLRSLIQRLQAAGIGRDAPVAGHEHLCPHCYAVAEIGQVECDTCRGTFKSPRKAGLLSLLFPGFGDFYMGHKKLATLEMAVVGLVWIGVFLPDPEYPMTLGGAVVVAVLVLLFLHVPDALGTWFLARRGVFPEGEGRRAVRVRTPTEVRELAGI